MKRIILISLITFFSNEAFPQYLIIHKNVESSFHSKISEIDSITFCPETVDYSGKTYNVVVIGDQCWLKENLDVGTMISGANNQTNNNPNYIEKYCYNDEPDSCIIYGGLYQWDEAMQYTTIAGTQGICPPEWHMPTRAEFDTLLSEVGNDGNALKEIGQGTFGGVGTNTSGFSALLTGYRYTGGSFQNWRFYARFWSSTENNNTSARSLNLRYNDSSFNLNYYEKEYGYSIRCIKD